MTSITSTTSTTSYSSRMASTGLILMALAAGAKPASTPIADTTKAAKMAVQKPT